MKLFFLVKNRGERGKGGTGFKKFFYRKQCEISVEKKL
jgi:hypothetical protein